MIFSFRNRKNNNSQNLIQKKFIDDSTLAYQNIL